jgi:hypothetical protein
MPASPSAPLVSRSRLEGSGTVEDCELYDTTSCPQASSLRLVMVMAPNAAELVKP